MKTTLLSILLAWMTFSIATAQIVTDRPDQTESSATVGGGDFQIEGGILVSFDEVAESSGRQFLLPTNLIRFGLVKCVELRLLSQFETQKFDEKTVEGISDLQIGTKIQILQNENINAEIAILSHLLVPSGSKTVTGDAYGTINKLCISHSLTDNMGLGYNVGYNYFGEDNGDLTYSLSLAVGVNERMGVFIEPYGQVTNFEDFMLNFNTGFTYLAKDNLQFDFSFGTGITDRMNFISAGCSWLVSKDR